MGLFSNKNEGGIMDVIRCDEQEYLVHKWTPTGGANSTKKENSIRYGSSLRVKDGELAVFVYQQKGGFLKSTYYGGNSIERHLSGLVADDGAINMSYHEINKNGELMT